ncbi:MAG: YgiT-type zinc finger protein [Methanobacteriota archaeon]|nr:MAG: YgiT-type zinc finger protein [Euryarchaeota archaeon]TMI37329.1 MAG: YgiT-type zinc finger protein [Candidatus Bathyarchaeota archaeon]
MAGCPACGKGELHRGKVREQMFGVDLGEYPAEICDSCGESFVDQKAMRKIEARAKELGLWGLAKKVSIAKSGNSLVVRIPAELARFLKLKGGEDALVRPEGREKIVVELG